MMHRRSFIWSLGALGLIPRSVFASPSLRIASVDYALSEMLLALDHPPIALTAATDWNDWVVEPPLPDHVVDLGSTLQANLELLSQLEPDLILTTDYVAQQEAALAQIAPVKRFDLYGAGTPPFERSKAVMLELARMIGAEARAKAYLAEANDTFDECADILRQMDLPPVYVVNFMDARHVRVYGGDGLFQSVLSRIGLRNAYRGPANAWGFETIGIEKLASDEDAILFAVEPVPPDALETLETSPLWRSLPFVERDQVKILPPVLAFGGLPSALRLAKLLTDSLSGRTVNGANDRA